MAIATLPDEEYEYVPNEADDTGSDGKPLDPTVAPDDDPNVSVPDEPEVAGEQLEDAAALDSDQFDPVGSGSDLSDDPTPIYQRAGAFIALDVPIAEQATFDDAGDLYSTATGSPDDADWGNAPDAGPAVAASASVPVLPDFDIEVHGEPEETEADPQPVQYEIQGKSDVAAWHTLALVSAQSMDAEVAGLPTSENWVFRIRAIYDDGFIGPWSAETMIDLPNDLLAPPVPSMPTLVAERGVITVHWDGSTLSGLPQPPDYKHTAVWVSTSGEIGTWTIAGLLFADGGYLPYTFADYNVPHYFSLSSRDIVGNESARGPAATVTLKPMVEELEFQQIIQDWDAKWGGVITEAEQLSEKLRVAQGEIDTAEVDLKQLKDVDLPALSQRLSDADASISASQSELSAKLAAADAELAGHRTRLSEAEASLGTLNGATLPALESDLEAAKSSLGTLDARLAAAQSELTAASADLGSRLSVAEGELSTAQTEINKLETDVVLAAKTAAIENLYVTGVGAISEAVIEKLWADVITARKIVASQVLVGSGTNMIAWNPEPNQGMPHVTRYGSGASTEPKWGGTDGVSPGTGHLILNSDAVASGSDQYTWKICYDPSKASPWATSGFPVEPGEEYLASIYYKSGGSYPDGAPDMRIGLVWYTGEGAYISGSLSPQTPLTWSWARHEVSAKAPATAAYAIVFVRQNRQGNVRVDLPSLQKKSGSSLIVNGSVTGDHVEANSVAAKVATVIQLNADRINAGIINTARLNTDAIAAATAAVQKADIKNLTVSSGTFSSAVIEKLWADVITARKIMADQVMIGSGSNLIVDPYFDNEVIRGYRQNSSTIAGGYGTNTNLNLRWFGGTQSSTGGFSFFFHSTPARDTKDALFPVADGDVYRFRGRVNAVGGKARWNAREYLKDGTWRFSASGFGKAGYHHSASAGQWMEDTYTPADIVAAFIPYIAWEGSTTSAHVYGGASVTNMSDGGLIVAGSVDAAAINSQSVSAEVAKFINLDVSRLVSSSAKISEAVITKLWTDVVHSRKITTEMLAVGSFDNIIPDPGFAEGPTTWGAATSNVSYGVDGELGYMQIVGDSAQRGYYSPYTEVMGGEEYHFTVRISRTTAGNLPASSIGMYVWSIDQSGARVGLTDVSAASFLDAIAVGAGDWRTFRGSIVLPLGAVKARFGLYSQTSQTATIRFTQPKATRVAGATLIGDGAIITDKLATNAITASKIAANAVTADKVHATAIDGMVITGATMRTNSAGTGIIINNSGIEGKTSAGRKFFLSALTGELDAIGSITTGTNDTFRAKLSNRDGIAALDIYSAGGDAAHHAALISWDNQVALRRYTNRTAYDSELAMTSGFTRLQHTGGGSNLSLGSGTANVSNGTDSEFGITYSGTRMRYGTGSELYLTGSTARLATTNGGDILRSLLYNGAYHTVMGQVEATTTTGGANINCNAGYIRKVTSASKYKLFPQAFDETLDDKILSVDAKHWIDKREAEETAELMCPETLDEATDPAIDPNQRAANPMRRVPGVIAEEVRDAGLDEFVVYDANGEVEGVMYDRLGVALIPVVKRQRDRITQLESQMEQLLARVEALEAA